MYKLESYCISIKVPNTFHNYPYVTSNFPFHLSTACPHLLETCSINKVQGLVIIGHCPFSCHISLNTMNNKHHWVFVLPIPSSCSFCFLQCFYFKVVLMYICKVQYWDLLDWWCIFIIVDRFNLPSLNPEFYNIKFLILLGEMAFYFIREFLITCKAALLLVNCFNLFVHKSVLFLWSVWVFLLKILSCRIQNCQFQFLQLPKYMLKYRGWSSEISFTVQVSIYYVLLLGF